MSLSKCIGKTYTAPELHTELRGLARQYAKTMDVDAAEKRAAAELLESTMDDLETVRDHLIARGFPLDVKAPEQRKKEFKFTGVGDTEIGETVPAKNVTFEVAPDPNNTELTGRWNAIDFSGRKEITDSVASDIIPRVLRALGVRGEMSTQVGGYMENNNPSLALGLERSEDLVPVAKALGHVLSQDSMVVVSDTAMEGLDANGSAIIKLPEGYGPQEIAKLFDRLRTLKDADGNTMVDGHTTKNGEMGLLNFTGLDNDEFARTVFEHLGGEFDVDSDTIYSTLISHKEYGYGQVGQEGTGNARTVQRELDHLRGRAARLLEEALAKREGGGRFNLSDQRGAGRPGQADEVGGRGDDARQASGYGEAVDGATSVVGIHYSQEPRTALDANKYGTGIKGAEAARLGYAKDERLKSRTYFYVDEGRGVRPEPGLGVYRHTVSLNNLYNVREDSLGIIDKVRGDLSIPDSDYHNAWESAILDAGFDGYYVPGGMGNMGAAVVIGPQHTAIPVAQDKGTEARFSLSPQQTAENRAALGHKVISTVDDAKKVGAMDVINRIVGNIKMPAGVRRDMGALKQLFMQSQQVANRYEEARELLRINEEAEEARTEGRHKMIDPILEAMKPLSDVQETKLVQVIHALDGRELKGVEANKFVEHEIEVRDNGTGSMVKKLVAGTKGEDGITRYELNEQHYVEMRAALKAVGVDDAVIDAYIAIRKSLDSALAQTIEKMQELRVDANLIDQMRSSIGRLQNYFPHMRFGDHYINVTNEAGETIYNEHVEAGSAGRLSPSFARRIELVKAAYPNDNVTWGKMREVPESVFEKGIDTAKLVQIVNAAVDRMKESDPTVKDSLRKEISRHISQVLLARGWGQHAMKRKGIPGYELQDIKRVLVAYHSGHQGWLAKIDKAHKFSVAMGTIDSRTMPGLYDWSRKYVSDMLRNQDAWDRRSSLLRSLLSVWYIGGRISSALVNLTQNLIATIPVLSIESGLPRAVGIYLKNAGRTIAYNLSGAEGRAKHMKPGELEFIKEFSDKGITADRFMRDIAGIEQGDTTSMLRNVASVLMTPFMIVERFNRASTALAAYRMARDGQIDNPETLAMFGKRKGEKFSEIEARDFARAMVNDAHFLPGKDNLPQVVRSGPAAWRATATALYTFKGYPHALMGMWRRMLTKQGSRGVAAFGYSMAATAAMGGVLAIPFAETLLAAIRGAGGDDDPERWLHKQVRKMTESDTIHDAVFYGVGALAGAGVTLKNSMDMNLPIVGDVRENKPAMQQIADKALDSMLGVPWSFVTQVGRSIEFALNGNTYRAIETASPAFAGSLMKAVRLSDEGATDSSGRPMAAPGKHEQFKLEGGESIAQSLGFNPVSKQKMQDANMSVQRMEEHKQAVQARLVKRYVQAKKSGDSEAIDKIIAERSEFNAKMRENGHSGLVIKEPLAKLAKSYMKPKKISTTKRGEFRDAGAAWGFD